MSKSFPAPPRIRRIAARRVFKAPGGKPVVVTLGVPQAVPGSDWGCPLQITGLKTTWQKPRYVFGIDGLHALHLAMKCADVVLQSSKLKLEWLGQTRFWRSVERAHKAKTSKRRERTKAAALRRRPLGRAEAGHDGMTSRTVAVRGHHY